jgi:hypothetical protein
MNPRLSATEVVAIEVGADLVLQDTHGATLARLDRVGAVVWEMVDGATPVPAIARRASAQLDRAVSVEDVFKALDRLADAGLLERRVAPPAGLVAAPRPSGELSRRSLLGRAAAGLAPAALAGLAPAAALGQDIGEQLQKTVEADQKEVLKDTSEAEGKQEALNKSQEGQKSIEQIFKEAEGKTVESNAKEGQSKASAEATDKQIAEVTAKTNAETDGKGSTAVPEPATAAILAAGAAGIIGLRVLQERRGKVAQEDSGESDPAD